jgi:hypothetical protein
MPMLNIWLCYNCEKYIGVVLAANRFFLSILQFSQIGDCKCDCLAGPTAPGINSIKK